MPGTNNDPFPRLKALARAWRHAYGPLPLDYLCWDCETQPVGGGVHLVRQIGWCDVRGGKVAGRGSERLAWEAVLDGPRREAFEAMAKRGARGWHAHPGTPPKEAVRRFADRVAANPVLVTFNGWAFDAKVFAEEAASFGVPVAFRPTGMIDAGVFVKAAQSGVYPRRGETYKDYAGRALSRSGGAHKWALHDFWCAKVRPRLGPGEEFHDARTDAYLTHLVVEWFRRAGEV